MIEGLSPCIDGGRFAAKRILGEQVLVQADVFADGHEAVRCMLLHQPVLEDPWQRSVMSPLGNDRWQGSFRAQQLGRCLYTVEAWVDHLETWRADLLKRHGAGQDPAVDLLRGSQMVHAIAARADGTDAQRLRDWADALADRRVSAQQRVTLSQSPALHQLAQAYPDRAQIVRHEPALVLQVERERARYSTWYEMFPRSTAADPGVHGTFADCQARLAYVARLGFDVLYLPPIHPIGSSARRGPNNQLSSDVGDPGSPWAIGSEAGGHKAVNPRLGTLEDFRRLVSRATELGMEIALDIAFQCSPDHPYVREHPEWFLKRPDGTIQYAENPPKTYQDIYPFNFESPAWRELWHELASIFDFWLEQGVRIFRVDNPHTKPFGLWEWLIARVQRRYPEAIFLAEAFTRPKVMYRLAKAGFTQSYTYFAWRNTGYDLTEYFCSLRTAPVSDFFRPNLWPNTPDILTEYLQFGGRPAFMARLVLAAT
ncbi:MAG: maltotransferase domain-containing protein, partial [Rhodanobacteraceae bacterium]